MLKGPVCRSLRGRRCPRGVLGLVSTEEDALVCTTYHYRLCPTPDIVATWEWELAFGFSLDDLFRSHHSVLSVARPISKWVMTFGGDVKCSSAFAPGRSLHIRTAQVCSVEWIDTF